VDVIAPRPDCDTATMSEKQQPQTARLRAAGVAATALLIALGAAAQFVNYGLNLGIGALDSSDDGGAFGLVGKLALLAASLAAWWVLARAPTRDPAVAALPVLLTFLSLDKALRLHDDVALWPLLYAPALVVTAVSLVVTARRLPAPAPGLAAAGLGLLALALVLHGGAGPVLRRVGVVEDSWASQVTGMTKHGAEVGGWLLVALALALGVRERRVHSREAAQGRSCGIYL
jgi:hypothetical protein